MKSKTNLKAVAITITAAAVISIGLKLKPILKNYDQFHPEHVYKVHYNYFFKSGTKDTWVKTFIPNQSSRQRISETKISGDSTLAFHKYMDKEGNQRAIWSTGNKNAYHTLHYEFLFEGKAQQFTLPKQFDTVSEKDRKYLNPTKNIQSDHTIIHTLATQLRKGADNDRELVRNIFDHVAKIPSAPIITLTDALATVEQNRASCNGKSRLFVALSRNLGYPARIKGGIILENTNKRTSHVWAEVRINGRWIPFDATNDHFAYLPSNYLELYGGDQFLITHTPDIPFDYTYQIDKMNHISFLKMNTEELQELTGFSLWPMVTQGVIPMHTLRLLLLLPIGGLLVAFLRNIVGIKTFGVFLPALIAFSLTHTGLASGLLLFVVLILLIGLISYPFDKLGLLYTPKLVISLTIMIAVMVLATYAGMTYDIPWLTTISFFPIIILTIAAERFSRATMEDGYKVAFNKLLQTLLATVICFGVLSLSWLPLVLILFPEIMLLIIVLAALLGRYIGIRWIEFRRFKPILSNSFQ